mmetsp:Transcript_28151/g.70311  ORF Transcript_28151/g.70311 Transcript_28151/m.70311 type:complete len:80 (+) Transcript_28151:970-1209(+)
MGVMQISSTVTHLNLTHTHTLITPSPSLDGEHAHTPIYPYPPSNGLAHGCRAGVSRKQASPATNTPTRDVPVSTQPWPC